MNATSKTQPTALSLLKAAIGLCVLLLGGVVSLTANTSVEAAGHELNRSAVYRMSDSSLIAHASSVLRTDAHSASFKLRTRELPAGNIVTAWWVIFNSPEHCKAGKAPYRCGEGDLPPFGGDGSARPSLVFGAGLRIPHNGAALFEGHLSTQGTTNQILFGPALLNPLGADIHLVLRDHGAPFDDPQMRNVQLTSFQGCNPKCMNIQFAIHEQ